VSDTPPPEQPAEPPDGQPPDPRPDPRAWIAVGGAIFGAFLALLDVAVVNSSLPQIQGEIGATGTEGTWIGTGYIVAEIVMIPLTAWLGRLLGFRNFLVGSAALFALFSVLCGLAGDLTQMIVGRVGQGFVGGALIPASLTIIATRLTPKQRPVGLAIYATVAVTAPVVGPIVGGWLTETAAWQWVFFMNLPIVLVLIALIVLGIDRAPPNWQELTRADWFGMLGLALLLGAGTVILEEGQRENWFESDLIRTLAWLSGIGLVLLLATQFRHPHPVIKLRLLLRPSYAALFLVMALLGTGSFALVYVVPVFLGTVAGYNAQQTGLAIIYTGLAAFLIMPALTLLLGRLDLRLIVATGMAVAAAGSLMNVGLTVDSGGDDFLWSLITNGIGQSMVGLPLSQAATAGLAEEDIPDGTALFNMARNLGGSVGLAMTGVLLDRRVAFHVAQLQQSTSANSPLAQDRIAQITGTFSAGGADPAVAALQAMKLLAGEIQRQALVMSFADGFWLVGVGFLLAIPATLLLERRGTGAPGAMH
jgi:DHA2 family multidrug resistance protein